MPISGKRKCERTTKQGYFALRIFAEPISAIRFVGRWPRRVNPRYPKYCGDGPDRFISPYQKARTYRVKTDVM